MSVTYLHRGLLNPPSGTEDFVSGGTLSRHVEGAAPTLDVVLETFDALDASLPYYRIEDKTRPGYRISAYVTGSLTSVVITARIPIRGAEVAGADVLFEYSHSDIATNWGADSSSYNSSGDTAYYEFVWNVGALEDETHVIDLRVGSVGAQWEWRFGTSGTLGTWPATNGLGLLSYSSTETGFGSSSSSFDDYATDIEVDLSATPSTVTDGDAIAFGLRYPSWSTSGHSANTVTIQISDAVTCSSPTTVTNTDGWTVGTWTSPGGGVQWQCVVTFAATITGGTAKEVTFTTTTSSDGTWALSGSGSGYDNAQIVYDTGGANVTVDAAIPYTIDATSGKAIPADGTEAAALLSAAGVSGTVIAVYNFGAAASGDIIDDTTNSYDLTPSGTVARQQTVSGWTAQSAKTTAGTSGKMIDTGFGNVNANSYTVILLAQIAAGSAQRTIMRFGATFDDDATLEMTSAEIMQIGEGNGSRSSGAGNISGAVIPFVLRVDNTAALVDGFTHSEKVKGGPQTCNGTELCFGGDNGQTYFPAGTDYIHAMVVSSALTNQEIKDLLTTSGWTVAWDAWETDATSGKAVPADATEWAAFISANSLSIAVPDHLFLCDEGSGNLTDELASKVLTASGTTGHIGYGASESGWSRGFLTFTNSGSGYFENTAFWPASLASNSAAVLTYSRLITAPAGDRHFLAVGGSEFGRHSYTSTPRMKQFANANNATGSSDPLGAVRPNFWRCDVTATENRLSSDQETLVATYDAPALDDLYIGGGGGSSAAVSLGYMALWYGSNAEFSSATMKAFQTAAGWSPAY